MTLTERARTIWAEWAPEYHLGYLCIGSLVFTTRAKQRRAVFEQMRLGIRLEQTSPGYVEERLAEFARQDGEAPLPEPVHLRAV